MVARFRCRHSTNLVKYGPYHFHLEQIKYIVRMETEEYSKSDSVSISIHVLGQYGKQQPNIFSNYMASWLHYYKIDESN